VPAVSEVSILFQYWKTFCLFLSLTKCWFYFLTSNMFCPTRSCFVVELLKHLYMVIDNWNQLQTNINNILNNIIFLNNKYIYFWMGLCITLLLAMHSYTHVFSIINYKHSTFKQPRKQSLSFHVSAYLPVSCNLGCNLSNYKLYCFCRTTNIGTYPRW